MKKLIPVNTDLVLRGLDKKLRYKLEDVWPIAVDVLEQLRPHCHRCQLVGSVRRGKEVVSDIEIVAIRKEFEIGLFDFGDESIATVVNQWEMITGSMHPDKIRTTRRILPCGVNLDLFFATELNYGLKVATCTGSAEYSHQVLGKGWVRAGYKSIDGHLTKDTKDIDGHLTKDKIVVPVREEMDLYRLIGVPWKEPRYREVK